MGLIAKATASAAPTASEAVKKSRLVIEWDRLKEIGDRYIVRLSPIEAAAIETYPISDGGYQRDLMDNKVKSMEAAIQAGDVFSSCTGGILLKEKTILWIDGHHRKEAHVRVGKPVYVELILVRDRAHARFMFMKLNTLATKIPQEVLGAASRNPVAKVTNGLAKEFKALRAHVRRVIGGYAYLKTSRYFSMIEDTAEIPEEIVKVARIILEEWTDSPSWRPDTFPAESTGKPTRKIGAKIEEATKSAYCIPAVIHAVAAAVKSLDLTAENPDKVRSVVRIFKNLNWKDKKLRDRLRGQGMDEVCALTDKLVRIGGRAGLAGEA